MNSYARNENRVQALEARAGSGVDYEAIDRRHAELLALINSVFPEDPRRSRMDDLARLCGLPSAGYMKAVLSPGSKDDALREAALDAYGEDFRKPMKETCDRALRQIEEALGHEGIEQVVSRFPLIVRAAQIACEGEDPRQ